MSTQPLVTIVTPSFNQGQFIRATIESIHNQDYPHIEHLVIDGGSTDNTLAVLESYGNQVTWISEPDNGQSDAINKGFRRARGEIVAWLNSDDVYLPGAISESVAFLEAHPDVDLVYGDIQFINHAGHITKNIHRSKPFSLSMLLTKFATLQQPSAFFRKRILDKVGLLDETLHFFMDTELWIRIAMHGQGHYEPGIRAQARLHDSAKTVATQTNFWQERRRVLDRLYTQPDLPEEASAVKQEAYAHCELYWGENLLTEGKKAEARSHLWFALKTHPILRRRLLASLLLTDSYLGTKLGTVTRTIRDRFSSTPASQM